MPLPELSQGIEGEQLQVTSKGLRCTLTAPRNASSAEDHYFGYCVNAEKLVFASLPAYEGEAKDGNKGELFSFPGCSRAMT